MTEPTFFTYPTALGPITFGCEDGAIVRVAFGQEELAGTCAPTALSNRAANQVAQYLAGKRRVFDLPVRLGGTAFALDVLERVAAVPFGQTRTYADLAASAGHAGAASAAGSVLRANPLPLLVPCHRIVGSNGSLGGYVASPAVKRRLLALERAEAPLR